MKKTHIVETETGTREKRPIITAEGYTVRDDRGKVLTKSLMDKERDNK